MRLRRARDFLFKENNQAFEAVFSNNVSKMDMIFKTGGIKQEAIDLLIFQVRSVEMMKLLLRYGGDMHKLGPPHYPYPRTLPLSYPASLHNLASDSKDRRDLTKLIEFLIEKGSDVNAVDETGFSVFVNYASNGETRLCKLLVERGADSSAKLENGSTALHAAAENGHIDIYRYLVEDCGLDIEAESKDEKGRPRTPLFLAAMHGNIEVCGYLLDTGAKVDGGKCLQPLLSAAMV
jgi:ankyrin repeat protein